jgi:hypothetical protein
MHGGARRGGVEPDTPPCASTSERRRPTTAWPDTLMANSTRSESQLKVRRPNAKMSGANQHADGDVLMLSELSCHTLPAQTHVARALPGVEILGLVPPAVEARWIQPKCVSWRDHRVKRAAPHPLAALARGSNWPAHSVLKLVCPRDGGALRNAQVVGVWTQDQPFATSHGEPLLDGTRRALLHLLW